MLKLQNNVSYESKSHIDLWRMTFCQCVFWCVTFFFLVSFTFTLNFHIGSVFLNKPVRTFSDVQIIQTIHRQNKNNTHTRSDISNNLHPHFATIWDLDFES